MTRESENNEGHDNRNTESSEGHVRGDYGSYSGKILSCAQTSVRLA